MSHVSVSDSVAGTLHFSGGMLGFSCSIIFRYGRVDGLGTHALPLVSPAHVVTSAMCVRTTRGYYTGGDRDEGRNLLL